MCNKDQGYYQALHSLRCTKCNKYYPDKCECDVVRIYRVEDPDGIGMYLSPLSDEDITDKMQPYSPQGHLHPSPGNDSSISDWFYTSFSEDRHYFGFVSLKQLKMWLHDEEVKEGLHQNNFTIGVYELTDNRVRDTDYILGDTQAIFDKSFFTKVATLKLTEV